MRIVIVLFIFAALVNEAQAEKKVARDWLEGTLTDTTHESAGIESVGGTGPFRIAGVKFPGAPVKVTAIEAFQYHITTPDRFYVAQLERKPLLPIEINTKIKFAVGEKNTLYLVVDGKELKLEIIKQGLVTTK